MANAKALIIGIGSPFGADRLGWMAIDELRARGCGREDVRLIVADRPGAGLISLMEGSDVVILIDALHSGAIPGAIRCLSPDLLAMGDRHSNHGLGVADAIALGHALNALPSCLTLIGIEAGSAEEPPSVDWAQCVEMVENVLKANRSREG